MQEHQTIEIIKKAMPAVVSIVITKHLKDVERDMAHGVIPAAPGSKSRFHLPKSFADAHGMVQVGGGSGFIIDPDGFVLTNKHVISDPEASYTVILNDDRKLEARVLSRDPINDVAILKIEAESLPYIPLSESNLELGQDVVAIGNALGVFRNTVSVGIVSGLSRSITAQDGPKARPQEMRGLIQTDAAINPGNSGGPLLNSKGEAIGVNAAIVSGAQNIGFAIPVSAAKRDLDDVKNYGEIRRPFLGVRYITIDEDLQAKMGLPVSHGAIVIKESPHDGGVIPESPADKAGIRENDIILSCDGKDITKDYLVQDFLEEKSVGDKVILMVLRDGKEITKKAVLSGRN